MRRNVYSQGWKLTKDLDLSGLRAEEWNHFVNNLNANVIKMFNRDDL
jgi:hypothetical protein